MPESNQCPSCVHFWGDGKCDAFPEGIAPDILTGKWDHAKVYPDQSNTITYEEAGELFPCPVIIGL